MNEDIQIGATKKQIKKGNKFGFHRLEIIRRALEVSGIISRREQLKMARSIRPDV